MTPTSSGIVATGGSLETLVQHRIEIVMLQLVPCTCCTLVGGAQYSTSEEDLEVWPVATSAVRKAQEGHATLFRPRQRRSDHAPIDTPSCLLTALLFESYGSETWTQQQGRSSRWTLQMLGNNSRIMLSI